MSSLQCMSVISCIVQLQQTSKRREQVFQEERVPHNCVAGSLGLQGKQSSGPFHNLDTMQLRIFVQGSKTVSTASHGLPLTLAVTDTKRNVYECTCSPNAMCVCVCLGVGGCPTCLCTCTQASMRVYGLWVCGLVGVLVHMYLHKVCVFAVGKKIQCLTKMLIVLPRLGLRANLWEPQDLP